MFGRKGNASWNVYKKQETTMSRLNALKIHLVLPGTKTQIGGWETNRRGETFCDHMRTGFSCGTGGVCDILASLGHFLKSVFVCMNPRCCRGRDEAGGSRLLITVFSHFFKKFFLKRRRRNARSYPHFSTEDDGPII